MIVTSAVVDGVTKPTTPCLHFEYPREPASRALASPNRPGKRSLGVAQQEELNDICLQPLRLSLTLPLICTLPGLFVLIRDLEIRALHDAI